MRDRRIVMHPSREQPLIRTCILADVPQIFAIINESAEAYRGVIPPDCWHEPYMPLDRLQTEIADGVRFWGYEVDGELVGVMGLQERGAVNLVRHAYVRSSRRKQGIGGTLLRHVERLSTRPILIGTWAAATWAIGFYEKHGYRLLSKTEAARLLKTYWSIPDRQLETSVVLASPRWTGQEEVRTK